MVQFCSEKELMLRGRLCLPSFGPGFDPQAQHILFFILYFYCDDERTKINKKRLELAHSKRKKE